MQSPRAQTCCNAVVCVCEKGILEPTVPPHKFDVVRILLLPTVKVKPPGEASEAPFAIDMREKKQRPRCAPARGSSGRSVIFPVRVWLYPVRVAWCVILS